MWDKRYSLDEYVYGKSPNDFLRENVSKLKSGKVLCLAEGEGRNAVFLAKQGFDVTALDSSAVGLKKAKELALENSVKISTVQADLNDYEFEPDTWDSIVSIFCHLPPRLREKVHKGSVTSLKDNGVFLLEAYTPEQVEFGTGGPPSAEFMMTLELLTRDLADLEFIHRLEKIREVVEGVYHSGKASVVQVIAKKHNKDS